MSGDWTMIIPSNRVLSCLVGGHCWWSLPGIHMAQLLFDAHQHLVNLVQVMMLAWPDSSSAELPMDLNTMQSWANILILWKWDHQLNIFGPRALPCGILQQHTRVGVIHVWDLTPPTTMLISTVFSFPGIFEWRQERCSYFIPGIQLFGPCLQRSC